MFFPERERTVLRYWVGSWAAVCVASCLFTVSNISVFRFTDFPLSISHFPFAILMRHNVRHSIFNLMAINHARQKCSSPCSSPSVTLSLSNVFLGFPAECCHIFLWLEAGKGWGKGDEGVEQAAFAYPWLWRALLQWVYYAAATLANPTHWHITCQRIFFNKLGKTYTPSTLPSPTLNITSVLVTLRRCFCLWQVLHRIAKLALLLFSSSRWVPTWNLIASWLWNHAANRAKFERIASASLCLCSNSQVE